MHQHIEIAILFKIAQKLNYYNLGVEKSSIAPSTRIVTYVIVRAPDSVSRLFRLVPMPEGTKMLRVDLMVVDHAENEYHRAHVRRWGVSEI